MAEKEDSSKKKTKKSFKEFDPTKFINTEPVLREAAKNAIVVSFGRFNPITVGHEKLVNRVVSEAAKRRADAAVYMSHSQDPKKNPLSYDQKISLGQKAFGRVVKKSSAKTIIEVAKELSGKYDDLVIVVGADRLKEFETLLNKYNEKEYSFKTISVVSAGERDPDADDITGMSASKMRSLASQGDLDSFKNGLPNKLKSSAKEIYDMVRKNMNITEGTEEVLVEREPLTLAQRRKRGIVMRRYKTKIRAARERAKRKIAPKEKLLKRAKKRALEFIRDRLMKSKKYSEMSPSEKIALDKRLAKVPQAVINRVAKRLLPQVRKAEMERLQAVINPKTNESNVNETFELYMELRTIKPQDPDVSHLPGSQPKGYYSGVKKSVKDDRARHFAKYAKKSDDVQSSYKPAPGDAGAKTKPSVHTKKFKQMFGESLEEASLADTRVRSRPHMALEKDGSVKFDRRFKIFRKEMNESYEDLNEDLVGLMLDMDSFVMSEEFDTLMEANPEEALKKKAEKSGISYGILKKVFDRGVAAWRTGHRPGTTPTQWGLARVNSFATKGKGTWGKADSDLAARVRKEEVEIEEEADGKKRNRALLASGRISKDEFDRRMGYGKYKTKDNSKKLDGPGGLYKNLVKRLGEKVDFDEAVSPTAVHPLVHVKEPNKAVKVSAGLKHKLGIGLTMKHMLQHGIRARDVDNDGDVDKFEKGTPDEITGTEKKNLTRVMQKKYDKEARHTRIGHAFESTEVNEQESHARAKLAIAREKEADREKHKRMLDVAKRSDAAARSRMREGVDKSRPENREDGTDSLVKIYRDDTPGQTKSLKEFMLTNTYGQFKKGEKVRFNRHSMDMFDGKPHIGTVIGGDTSWLRVRDDKGMLFKVRHYDAVSLNEATKTRGFEGKMITVKNVPVRMADGTIKRLPPGKSSSSDGDGGNGNGD